MVNLYGAITNVLVNDPTQGYAVFGDIMLKEMREDWFFLIGNFFEMGTVPFLKRNRPHFKNRKKGGGFIYAI